MIKGISFDLDGTLIDSANALARSWELTFSEVGMDVKAAEIKKFIGSSPDSIVKNFKEDASDKELIKFRELRKKHFFANLNTVNIFPEVGEVLSDLGKRGVKQSIASSMGNDMIDKIVKNFHFDEYMCCWISGDKVRRPKPFPDIFLESFNRMKINPVDCLVVGDRGYDIEGGRAAGAKTYLVKRDEFSNANADYIFDNLLGILDIL